ncbi:MAG: sel1 repeat family protein [Nitrospinae bacterium]|nr:sel1 repeat family protein [Nitrospinota bacterium]
MKTHAMLKGFFAALLIIFLMFSLPAMSTAGSFDDAVTAYQAGNYQKAFKLFKPFAEQGFADAQYNLGLMYDNGLGVTQDYVEAVKWYKKAAEQGEAIAQYNLGNMYENGEGVRQDYAEAVKWFRMAAEQGYAGGQSNLGVMYGHGRGVRQDYVQAYKWFSLSALRSQGSVFDYSLSNRNFIEKRMTQAQVVEAQKLAREWKPKTWKELAQLN